MTENQKILKPDEELERLLLQGLASDASILTQKDWYDLRAELQSGIDRPTPEVRRDQHTPRRVRLDFSV